MKVSTVYLCTPGTRMTGHQYHPATERNLRGEPAPAVDIAELCCAIDVKRVHEINTFDLENLKGRLRAETAAGSAGGFAGLARLKPWRQRDR